MRVSNAVSASCAGSEPGLFEKLLSVVQVRCAGTEFATERLSERELLPMYQQGAKNLLSVISLAAVCLVMPLFVLSACGGSSSSVVETIPVSNDANLAAALSEGNPEQVVSESPADDDGTSVVMVTNYGEITLLLDSEKAPLTVANFLRYVDAGHYEQTIFHRVIPGFMIQGGGFSVGYQRNETLSPILNEAANGLANDRYTIAMARTSAVHSATDQFFINIVDNPFLNYREATNAAWGYAVFGSVTSGFDVIEEIASVTTGAGGPFVTDAPVEPVIIISIERE